tara:strand:+ start:750 stop:1232 length:483 start_codon:yes stop_codon:yes gene_type:complete
MQLGTDVFRGRRSFKRLQRSSQKGGSIEMLFMLAVFLMSILPLVIAVMGYLCFFYELNWLYLLIVLGVWILSIVITVTCSDSKEKGLGIYYEAVGGGIGWVWILFIPATLWFLVSAVFFEGSWSEFSYTFVIGCLGKATLREFQKSSAELSNKIQSKNNN